jgi:hypothetical protein
MEKALVRIELGHNNSDRGSASGKAAAEWALIAAADVEDDSPQSGEIRPILIQRGDATFDASEQSLTEQVSP